jgi:SAM-dependent methyltransferase
MKPGAASVAKWDNGYVSDVVYTRHAYQEMTPAWLATMALLLGKRPPNLSKPFRYADLGCGHGLTATIVAATCPHAEVWAFDFNPAHIESGRHLAASAGLTNLHFQEASFAELAALPTARLPEFDFIVSHGVASWISPADRASLIQIIGQRLRAGGLAYLSYNLATGWASMMPVRSLMRTLMGSTQARSDQASTGILDYLDKLKDAGAHYFTVNPVVAKRLGDARPQEARYLAHEYLNADWHPLMFAEMAEAMSEVKCTFIGSATPSENLDALSVPAPMLNLMAATPDRILRETLRDFAVAQTFRRDIYRRGSVSLTGPEQLRLFDEIEPIWTGRPPEDPIQLSAPLGQLNGLPEVYGPLMQMIMEGGHTMGSIRRSGPFAGRAATDLSQAVSLLMASNYIQPALPETVRAQGRAPTDRLNAAICADSADGGDISLLAATSTGTGLAANPVEMLVLRELLSGRPVQTDAMIDSMLTKLRQAGRSVQHDGKIVEDMARARAILQESVVATLNQRVPLFGRLGIIPT